MGKRINWSELKHKYFISDCNTVAEFLKKEKIKNSGTSQKNTKGWNKEKKKWQEEIYQKASKMKQEEMAEQIKNADKKIQELSVKALGKIEQALEELQIYMIKSTNKTKEITYNYDMCKPSKEVITEKEEYTRHEGVINTKALRELTSALKEIKEIGYSNIGLNNNKDDEEDDETGVIILPEIIEDDNYVEIIEES